MLRAGPPGNDALLLTIHIGPGMLRISLTPSHYLAALLGIAHAGVAVTVLWLDIPVAAKVLLELAVSLSAGYSIWRDAFLRSPRCIIALELDRQGRISVQPRGGDWEEAELLGTTFVSPILTILNLRLRGRRFARHVVILPDSLPSDEFRRLRVLLRWSKPGASAQAQDRSQ